MTNRYDLIKMQEKLQKKLTPDRYQHTLGVMYTCAALAMCHGCNLERAMVGRTFARLCKMYTKR